MERPLFSSLELSPEILKAVEALGFEEASPIQAAAIPVLMSGKDVVGQSQTGSGKTAAFAIPAIELLDPTSKAVQVLILCPTRELATQVSDEVHKLLAFKRGVSAVPIYGGASYERQFYELKKGVQIVIGTPGRVMDHLDRGTLKLDNVRMVVLDEADRMLDMGFRDDMTRILDCTPAERQTVFFSATVSKPIRELINRYARDPESVKIEQKELSAPDIEQYFYEVPHRMKNETLIRLIDFHGFKLGIIFCNTQRMVDELADILVARGYSADRLHGGITQAQRTRVMTKFKKAEFEFLVATDVAARGIDVDDLEFVVNYDIPYDAEDYVHRIGRTGRAGRRGMAATFVSGRDIYKLGFIERFTRTKMRRGTVPTADEVEEKRTTLLLDKVRTTIDAGDSKQFVPLVDRLLEEGLSTIDIAAALFHLSGAGESSGGKVREIQDPSPTGRPERASRSSHREDDRGDFRKDKERRRPEEGFEGGSPRFDAANKPTRPASRGMQWISISAGKNEGVGPREIVSMLSEGGTLPPNSVGLIQLSANESFAQVPESFASGLSSSGNNLTWERGEVTIRPLPRTKASPEGKFAKKEGGFGKRDGGFGKKPGPWKKKWRD